ncbi:hypothetical protein NUW58_g9248 [Xylaria curta]|uniref:Uncharacterized protein n=1 Tax=Xylaria curta TaxID=42375 RepID=A0ACC1N0H4_9PEZI|nr:hypothetical protein NUW58_g9248 [Xylaria curta]
MGDEEPDYSSLPLTDRPGKSVNKPTKDAAKQFEVTPDDARSRLPPLQPGPQSVEGRCRRFQRRRPVRRYRRLLRIPQVGGREGCMRSRGQAIAPIVEKGLVSTRPATNGLFDRALLLLIELDVAAPVVEDILPAISAKQPKVIAAALAALTTIFHKYGCKVADPKPVLKILPKAFGHADKNVRAEATNLAVEFYRWLRDAMKPMFGFEKVKAEPAPKQERLLRSQQEAIARAPPPGAESEEVYDDDGAEEPAEMDAFDLAEPQDVLSKVPATFHENLASSKWKDRKEALEGLFTSLNVPRIKDADFNEINRGLAKSMKDANIAVVTQAAQCIEVLAKGLRQSYGKYRSIVMAPIMERLKEKKQSVADALGAALDQVFLSTSLTECLEDILAFLNHKNPQVKEGTMKFLVRCLRTTREVPSKQEVSSIVEAAKKLLSESSEGLRSGGAEVLGTVMKIVGERAMNPHVEGLDDIRKTKIKEFFEKAEVKAKDKPKPKPAPAPAYSSPAEHVSQQSRPCGRRDMEVSLPASPFPPDDRHWMRSSHAPGRGRVDKVNAELVVLTYGTIVAQLCKDFDSDYVQVNKQLDKMGYNIGLRLIEDYLAKSNTMRRCSNFRETADMLAKVGFKIFLNITPTVTNWTSDNKQFSLVFEENPLADFVELPDDGRAQDELWYSNIFCGVLRGALEMVQMQVEAHFISDMLRGSDTTEIRVSLIRYIDDELPPDDD